MAGFWGHAQNATTKIQLLRGRLRGKKEAAGVYRGYGESVNLVLYRVDNKVVKSLQGKAEMTNLFGAHCLGMAQFAVRCPCDSAASR
jgi:hypothetical protein